MMTLNSVAPPSPLADEPAAEPCCFISLVPCNCPVYVQQCEKIRVRALHIAAVANLITALQRCSNSSCCSSNGS
eukprot:5858-Heterococcus_DN1.PRE.3